MNDQTKQFLTQAVDLAEQAGAKGNHPCGAVVVNSKNEIIAAFGNQVYTIPDITAHAEMMCLREASKTLMWKESPEKFIIFCSCEPCSGCAFYISRTNVSKIIYASKDRYIPGISMLKTDPKLKSHFEKIEIIEEPYEDLRDRALNLFKNYFLSKNKPEKAKFFDPEELFNHPQ